GVISAQPMVAVLARYASRFSVRALDLTVDSSLLWVGAALAIVAAVVLAFVPRLPSSNISRGLSLASGSVRITGSASQRQRIFAVTQIAASFVLLVGASALITTLIALQRTRTGLDTEHVLSINVPPMSYGKTQQQVVDFYKEAMRRTSALPGVSAIAYGNVVPWRDGGQSFGFQFSGDGHVHSPGVEDPRARWRLIPPGYFAAIGVPIIAGRDFDARDTRDSEPVVIVSESLAKSMFPKQDPINRHIYWTDPVLQFIPGATPEKARFMAPHRIIGVTADIDDEHLVPRPMVTAYSTFEDGYLFGGNLFIHTGMDPYAAVRPLLSLQSPPPPRRAWGAPRHSRGCPRRSAHAGPPELSGVWRVRRGRAGDCRSRRGRGTGVLGQRADAGIRHSASAGITAAATPQGCARRGRRDGFARCPRRRGLWIRADASGRQVFPGYEGAWRLACGGLSARAADGGGRRLDAAGSTRCAR